MLEIEENFNKLMINTKIYYLYLILYQILMLLLNYQMKITSINLVLTLNFMPKNYHYQELIDSLLKIMLILKIILLIILILKSVLILNKSILKIVQLQTYFWLNFWEYLIIYMIIKEKMVNILILIKILLLLN